MNLSDETKQYLNETRKWTSFLAILGFIALGLIILAGFSAGAILEEYQDESIPQFGFFMGFIYLIFGAIYFFPIYFLFKFSNHMKNALMSDQEESVNQAFKNLNFHYKYIGILTIVILGFYTLGLIGFALIGFSL